MKALYLLQFQKLKNAKCIYSFIFALEIEKSQHGCVRWTLCEHLTSPYHDFTCSGLRGRGISNQKNHFRPIFSPFQAILNNFDFLNFWQQNLYGPKFLWLGGGGWLKSSKISFVQFSCHFRLFWTTLNNFDFSHFWQKIVVRPPIFFWGGGL